MTDKELIPNAISISISASSYAAVQKAAAKALKDGDGEEWPHNGCAANLSALLEAAGIGVPMSAHDEKLSVAMRVLLALLAVVENGYN